MDAVFGTGIRFGQSDGTAFPTRTPFVQIKREFDAVAAHIVDIGVGAVLRRSHPCRQGTVDMRTRGDAFGTVGDAEEAMVFEDGCNDVGDGLVLEQLGIAQGLFL